MDRLGAVAFSDRFNSTLNADPHFHCVVIHGVFAPAPVDGVVLHAAPGIQGTTIARVQESVRQRLLAVARFRAPRPVPGQ